MNARPSYARLSIFIILGFAWFSTAFLGGYVFGQTDALAGKSRVGELAYRASTTLGFASLAPARRAEAVLTADQQARFQVFWEAWGLLEREFYNRPALDSQVMTYGALKGLVESLGDPHTIFSTPTEREAQDVSLRGSFDGVGVQVDQRDGVLRVVAPIEGSPAEQAGIRAGDVIRAVDGKTVKDLTLQEVVQLIRGPRGTTVTLTIVRDGEPAPLEVQIQRAEIKLQSVRARMLDGGLGYLRITSFSSSTGADAVAAVSQLMASDPRGLVVDVRSNPGGYLSAAVDVASQFMSDGVVLYQQSASGSRQEYRSKAGGRATTLPVVVLIDRGSASASEIVAAALRDNGRAVLIGEPSYGKGTVQTVHRLSDSSGLRVTSAQWLTPSGRPLERNGLQPDLLVSGSVADQAAGDAQLAAAVRYLQDQATAAQTRSGV